MKKYILILFLSNLLLSSCVSAPANQLVGDSTINAEVDTTLIAISPTTTEEPPETQSDLVNETTRTHEAPNYPEDTLLFYSLIDQNRLWVVQLPSFNEVEVHQFGPTPVDSILYMPQGIVTSSASPDFTASELKIIRKDGSVDVLSLEKKIFVGQLNALGNNDFVFIGTLEQGTDRPEHNIYKYSLGPGTLTQLTFEGDLISDIAVSPKGEKIAYVVEDDQRIREVRIIDQGGSLKEIIPITNVVTYGGISWNWDASAIAITIKDEIGQLSIGEIDAATSQIETITDENDCLHPQYSPKEDSLFFVCRTSDGTPNIYSRLSNGKVVQLTFFTGLSEMGVSINFIINDDGEKILFRLKKGASEDYQCLVFILSSGSKEYLQIPTSGAIDIFLWFEN